MIERALGSVRQRIVAAATRAGRDPESVMLVAVSKGRSVEEIQVAYDAGQRVFAESRPQELASKVPLLPTDISWHFVGPLQRNKVRLVRPAVTLLHSLDRKSLAADWVKGRGQPPTSLLQVNISRDPAKSGFDPVDVESVAAELVGWGVPIRGLMTIPALSDDRDETRGWFSALAEIGRRLAKTHSAASELSMGMSDDFELAIESGSTMVRVGRAIFGSPN